MCFGCSAKVERGLKRLCSHVSRAHIEMLILLWAAGGLARIVKEEGMRGLYRGLSPTLFALFPNWAVRASSLTLVP